MNPFSLLLTRLQAAIAARAARERALTVLLVALWGRSARMGARLERLVRLWRAGTLPATRAGRDVVARDRVSVRSARISFPTAPGWLLRRLGYEVAAYGSQLQHLLTEDECVAFLAAVPQAGRILRPLLRMLTVDPLPEIVRRVKRIVPVAVVEALANGTAVTVVPVIQFSRA